ncbi:MAG TPA: serine/threonine-protein kinase [Polyangiaceae bacterium]|nr:serine/threonine-protein kinase [Polyangiaceae bacterium]
MAEPVPWVVAGRYEVGDIVGRGGYGMVRRALDRKTGLTVAMKVLSADAGRDPHLVERMLREQQAMVAMAGTCAVSAIDLCRLASGAPCLVMEWLDGCDLERQLSDWEAQGQRPSVPRLLEILRPLTDTLQRAHELGIVHRDIKPANVFLTTVSAENGANTNGSPGETGAVRLLDFGLSRMRSSAPLTAVGMVMGSPSYIPPETWRGNSALIDHRADLYSLAVIVFRALSGRLPFDTPSLVEKLKLVTTGDRPSVCALRPDLPRAVDDWMKRALAVEPEQRFQSARDFYDSLALALRGATLPLADDEVSGVREKARTEAALPAENPNVLSLAWQRATSLLQRFIGQKANPAAMPAGTTAVHNVPVESGAAAEGRVSAEGRVAEDCGAADAERDVDADAALEAVLGVGERSARSERPSVAWLDDSDVEDLPPESVLPTPPIASKIKPKAARGANAKKSKAKTTSSKPKKSKAKKKSHTAAKKPRSTKPRSTKAKAKVARKKH